MESNRASPELSLTTSLDNAVFTGIAKRLGCVPVSFGTGIGGAAFAGTGPNLAKEITFLEFQMLGGAEPDLLPNAMHGVSMACSDCDRPMKALALWYGF